MRHRIGMGQFLQSDDARAALEIRLSLGGFP
jgi:hypothetical protein